MDPKPETLVYVCGDCGTEALVKPGDITQCLECGYRILFKKRTRRSKFSFVCGDCAGLAGVRGSYPVVACSLIGMA